MMLAKQDLPSQHFLARIGRNGNKSDNVKLLVEYYDDILVYRWMIAYDAPTMFSSKGTMLVASRFLSNYAPRMFFSHGKILVGGSFE